MNVLQFILSACRSETEAMESDLGIFQLFQQCALFDVKALVDLLFYKTLHKFIANFKAQPCQSSFETTFSQ